MYPLLCFSFLIEVHTYMTEISILKLSNYLHIYVHGHFFFFYFYAKLAIKKRYLQSHSRGLVQGDLERKSNEQNAQQQGVRSDN